MKLQYGPSFHGETYFNRKKKYPLNIQAICDKQSRFTFVSSAYPGSVSDATVFCESSFFQSPNLLFGVLMNIFWPIRHIALAEDA